jgi:GNAT superfamily N-acetyltransferase
VGIIATQRPAHAAWVAPLTRLSPVAYTMLGYVTPDERSSGVGAALAAHLHDAVDPAGVAATLLHYEQLNPYAVPFWSRQGYRPLWTSWEARPARSLR